MQLPTITLLGLASAFPHQLKRFMRHASGESIRAGGNRKGGAGQSELRRRGITNARRRFARRPATHPNLLMGRPPNRRLRVECPKNVGERFAIRNATTTTGWSTNGLHIQCRSIPFILILSTTPGVLVVDVGVVIHRQRIADAYLTLVILPSTFRPSPILILLWPHTLYTRSASVHIDPAEQSSLPRPP
jgi:hypothetical protein